MIAKKILIMAAVPLGVCSADKLKKPNIIYLMADDHQAFALGCMGNKDIHTPNIDKLAGRGVLFKRAYSASPICMPARATTMTGMYEFKTGCNFNTGRLRKVDWENNSYPMLLKKNGYFIGFAGKWGINTEKGMNYQDDFDLWGGFYRHKQGQYQTAGNSSLKKYADRYPHVTRALGAFGIDFIKAAKKSGKPFCLSISFKAPHKPHRVIDVHDKGLYSGVTFSKRANYGDIFAGKLPFQPFLGRQRVQWPEWNPAHYQNHIKAYYQLISGVDTAVGMIIEELKRSGLANNTVIFYTSDNGYALGSHGFQGKCLPYEESARLPLIICDLRRKRGGKVCNSLVCNIDYAPTILDLAGVSVPERMDGKSLVPLLSNQSLKVHDNIMLIQNWGIGGSDTNKCLTVLNGKYKYIFWPYGDHNIKPEEELYNMALDPYEQSNILKSGRRMPEVLSGLRRLYDNNLKIWGREAVSPAYLRQSKILDRNVSWRNKEFKIPKKLITSEFYKRVVGKDAPDGFQSSSSKKRKRK